MAARLPLRVLVADDLQSNKDVLALLLHHLGYVPVTVGDGRRAVEVVASQPIDLMLLDIRMPELDGYQVAHEVIRLFPAAASRPKMIAVTSDDPAMAQQALGAGMDGYIPKPVTLSDLARSILQLFAAG